MNTSIKTDIVFDKLIDEIKNVISINAKIPLHQLHNNTNLNDINLDSIQIMLLLGDIEQKISNEIAKKHIELTYDILYKQPTIEGLTKLILKQLE